MPEIQTTVSGDPIQVFSHRTRSPVWSTCRPSRGRIVDPCQSLPSVRSVMGVGLRVEEPVMLEIPGRVQVCCRAPSAGGSPSRYNPLPARADGNSVVSISDAKTERVSQWYVDVSGIPSGVVNRVSSEYQVVTSHMWSDSIRKIYVRDLARVVTCPWLSAQP